MNKTSTKFKFCNHHHELTDKHKLINLGTGDFVANMDAIPLLKALNEAGLTTRTHHYTKDGSHAFLSILLDNVQVEVKTVNEVDADRTEYNGKTELLIKWDKIN